MRPWTTTACAPEHLLMLLSRADRTVGIEKAGGLLERARDDLASHGRTLWMGGIPVGALGVDEVALGGRAEAWMLLSDEARKHPLSLVRETLACIAEAWSTLHLWRLQAQCVRDDGIAYRFLGAVGFQDEALLRRFGPRGEDMVMFAMFGPPTRRAR